MNNDLLDNANELFASVLSDVTLEQWEEFKEQQTKHGMYVIEDESDNDSCGSDYRSLSPIGDEFIANVEVVQQLEEEASASEGSDNETKGGASWGCEAAIKYVNGEISFNELNAIMEDDKPRHRKRSIGSKKMQEPKDVSKLEIEDREYQMELKNRFKKKRRRMNHLPKELEGLMGAANLKFAQGNTEDAIKMCMELIRLAPTAQEPFQTLAVIYDEMREPRKSFQCSLVAAYLNPADTEEWIRLAELSVEQNQLQQAISCYTRAIRNEPTNINFLWERCNLHEQVGERKKALVGYEMILKQLGSPEDGEKCVEMSREISKIHHGNKDYINAIKVLETVFTKFPLLITSEDVNFLLELQMAQKMYKSAVKNFMQHCGVIIMLSDREVTLDEITNFSDEEFTCVERCSVPEILPIDLWVKVLMCLIHLKSSKAVQPLLESLKKENPSEIGDLYLDIAETLMDIKDYERAVELLDILLHTPNYDLPAVWMKYGECLLALSKTDEAVRAFERVLTMAPACQEARLALSKIHLACRNVEKAITVLRQEYEEGKETVLGIEALYEHCRLLESQGLWDEFIAVGTLLQYSHCYYLETEEEMSAVFANQTSKRRNEALRDIKTQSNKVCPEFVGQQIPVAEMLDIFKKVSHLLWERKCFAELQHISLVALTSTLLMKSPDIAKDIEFQALLSCYYNKHNYYAYLLVKDLVIKNLNNNKAWNLFCLIVTQSQENRHNLFCLRLVMKHQGNLALGYLNGHNALISGTYKHALGEYMSILKDRPNDPFAVFCVGITFTHMACQKLLTKRYFLLLQALTFLLKYLKLKGETQETLYNIGRALHQSGIKDTAVHFYKKALDAPIAITGEEEELFDLRKEIAYNLSQIYQSTGAMELASLYYRKYIVI